MVLGKSFSLLFSHRTPKFLLQQLQSEPCPASEVSCSEWGLFGRRKFSCILLSSSNSPNNQIKWNVSMSIRMCLTYVYFCTCICIMSRSSISIYLYLCLHLSESGSTSLYLLPYHLAMTLFLFYRI